jgi:hypothetical protein
LSLKQKMDSLDFTLNILREHERALDLLEQRLGSLVRELDRRVSSDEQSLEVFTLINLLEYRPFETPSFSFYKKPGGSGDHALIDKIYNRKLVFGRSREKSNVSLWSVQVFKGTEETSEKPMESHYFDSERTMLAWMIRYMLRESRVITTE